jgi:hypothetical protein
MIPQNINLPLIAAMHALFNVLETQNIIEGEAVIKLIPRNSELLGQLVAATQSPKTATGK